MSHPFYMTKPLNFLPFSLIIIISGCRYNLWSYTLWSFLQLPITSSHKSLRPDTQCFKIHSNVFPQRHRPSVTPTFMKILRKCQHTFIFQLSSYQKTKDIKTLWMCSEHWSKLISSQFLDSAIFITPCHFKILQTPHPSKISNSVSGRSFFFKVRYPHCASRIHNKNRNVASQCTTSL